MIRSAESFSLSSRKRSTRRSIRSTASSWNFRTSPQTSLLAPQRLEADRPSRCATAYLLTCWRLRLQNPRAGKARRLLLQIPNVRRRGVLHPDDVIAGVDVVHFAGYAARHIRKQIHAGVADFLDRHRPAQRRVI